MHKLGISTRSAVISAMAFLSVSCARVPPPPYPLRFTLDVAPPRLLESSQEVAVPVTLFNNGERAWDPARANV